MLNEIDSMFMKQILNNVCYCSLNNLSVFFDEIDGKISQAFASKVEASKSGFKNIDILK